MTLQPELECFAWVQGPEWDYFTYLLLCTHTHTSSGEAAVQKSVPTKLYVVSIVPQQEQKDQNRLGNFLRLSRNTTKQNRSEVWKNCSPSCRLLRSPGASAMSALPGWGSWVTEPSRPSLVPCSPSSPTTSRQTRRPSTWCGPSASWASCSAVWSRATSLLNIWWPPSESCCSSASSCCWLASLPYLCPSWPTCRCYYSPDFFKWEHIFSHFFSKLHFSF